MLSGFACASTCSTDIHVPACHINEFLDTSAEGVAVMKVEQCISQLFDNVCQCCFASNLFLLVDLFHQTLNTTASLSLHLWLMRSACEHVGVRRE